MTTAELVSRVLIVEDDRALREVYGEVLAAEGYEVHSASDGAEALALLGGAAEPPCAVVLDLRMPGMSGWELARRLHGSRRWRRVPIVVVAAHYLVAEEARQIGAVAWLQKPVSLDRLVTTVRAACATMRATHA
jgi:two-component system response regulator MprA